MPLLSKQKKKYFMNSKKGLRMKNGSKLRNLVTLNQDPDEFSRKLAKIIENIFESE